MRAANFGSFRKSPGERLPVRHYNPALRNETAHQSRRRDVESIIRHRRAVRYDAHRFNATVGGAARHGRYLLCRALFDRNSAKPLSNGEIDAGGGETDVERHPVVLGSQCFEISADLVADVAVRGHPVGTDDGEVDHGMLHEMAAGIVRNDGMRDAVLAELP